jgi:hypothetical protein
VTNATEEELKPTFGSEVPTEPAPERSALAARIAAKALSQPTLADEEVWCDSEAPTGVAAERPILPRPPRSPSV